MKPDALIAAAAFLAREYPSGASIERVHRYGWTGCVIDCVASDGSRWGIAADRDGNTADCDRQYLQWTDLDHALVGSCLAAKREGTR